MIDRESGTIEFEKPAISISPKLKRSQFLASAFRRGAKISVKNEPYCTWELRGKYRAGGLFLVSLCFRGQTLSSVDIALSDAKYGKSWDDWTEAKELKRKAAHDSWLRECIGTKRSFAWGKVSSEYDPRGGSSSICIDYKA